MKKTHTQFMVVFVGVLILHLIAATALMNSAQTGGTGPVASLPDPYYHSSPDAPKKSPGWGAAEKSQPAKPGANPAETPEIPPPAIPDAFAAAEAPKSESTAAVQTDIQPEPPKPAPTKKLEPAPVSPTRRLTVTQLLTPEPPAASDADADADDNAGTPEPAGLKVKPIPPPPAPDSNSGPRKIRSLSGN